MIVGLVNYLGCGFQTEDTQLGMLIAYLQNGLRVQQQQQVYFTEKETPPKKTVLDHSHTPWNTFTFTAIESFTKPSTGPYSVFTTGPAEPTVTHSSEDVNIASKSNAAITIFFYFYFLSKFFQKFFLRLWIVAMPVRPEDVDTGVFAAAQVEGRALLRAKDFVGAAAVFTAALAEAESAAKPFCPSHLSNPSPATEQQQPPQLQKAATKGAAAAAAAENSSQLLWSIEEAGASGTRLLLAKAWWCNGDSTRALSIIEELITKAESTTTTTTDANNGASIGSGSSSSSSLVPGSALHHEVYRTLAKLTLELVEQADGERLGGGGAEAAAAAAAAAAADVARRPTQQQLDAAVAACCLIAPALSAKGREGAFELSLIYEYKAKLHTAGCSCGSAAAAARNHPPCSCGKLLQVCILAFLLLLLLLLSLLLTYYVLPVGLKRG